MRDLLFKCPSCEESLAFDRKLAGKTLCCPSCKGQIAVPVPDAPCPCPSCNVELHVSSDAVGEFECPACNGGITISPKTPGTEQDKLATGGEPSESVKKKPDDCFICIPPSMAIRPGIRCAECGACLPRNTARCPTCDKLTGTPETDQTVDTLAYGMDPLDWNGPSWHERAERLQMPDGDRGPQEALSLYSQGVRARDRQDYRQAIVFYEQAIEKDPGFPWSFNNLAWTLATCPDESLRDGSRAISLARAAICLAGRPYWCFVDTLATAYAENGDFDKAVLLMEKAVDLAPLEERERGERKIDAFRRRETVTDNSPSPKFRGEDGSQ